MIAAYGPYAASATGGNDLARDFLAGIAAMYSTPCMHFPHCILETSNLLLTKYFCPSVYENVGKKYMLEYPTTILACLSILVILPVYIFYWKGQWFRDRSKFAKELGQNRQGTVEKRRGTAAATKGGRQRDEEKTSTHAEQV